MGLGLVENKLGLAACAIGLEFLLVVPFMLLTSIAAKWFEVVAAALGRSYVLLLSTAIASVEELPERLFLEARACSFSCSCKSSRCFSSSRCRSLANCCSQCKSCASLLRSTSSLLRSSTSAARHTSSLEIRTVSFSRRVCSSDFSCLSNRANCVSRSATRPSLSAYARFWTSRISFLKIWHR